MRGQKVSWEIAPWQSDCSLVDDHQSVAPGPRGGIQDANGNFGTPMSGIVTVLAGGQD